VTTERTAPPRAIAAIAAVQSNFRMAAAFTRALLRSRECCDEADSSHLSCNLDLPYLHATAIFWEIASLRLQRVRRMRLSRKGTADARLRWHAARKALFFRSHRALSGKLELTSGDSLRVSVKEFRSSQLRDSHRHDAFHIQKCSHCDRRYTLRETLQTLCEN